MTIFITNQIKRILPAWLVAKLRNIRFLRHLAHRWVAVRPRIIRQGIAAGLWFTPGQSNPVSVLGFYEPPVQETLAAQLRPGDIFFDIGANVGFFTVVAARLVGNHGRVVAFEPVPRNLVVLQKNVKRNGFDNVSVIAKAVSNQNGQGELILTEYSGGATLSKYIELPDKTGTVLVDIVTIDQLVQNGEVPVPSLIKIDVEGAELEVLSGMVTTLRSYHPSILLEVDDGDELALSKRENDCIKLLSSCGYLITQLPQSYPGISWKVDHFLALPELT
jgi:FkbM family methyltransferase